MTEKTDSVPDQRSGSGFKCWHFDALSDDGREALIITFNDNYPYSPRYFRESKHDGEAASGARFPAVTFTYSVDGKVMLRAVNEFPVTDFSLSDNGVNCLVGNSSFQLDASAYGSGFVIKLDLLTARRCRLEAEIEFLLIETGADESPENESKFTLIAAPRCDVTGRITRIGRRGRTQNTFSFRGTGYHDHLSSNRPLEGAVVSSWWGRAHFIDSTVIFRCDHSKGDAASSSKVFLVRDGSIHERPVSTELQNVIRDRYGLTVPGRLSFLSEDNIRLRVKPLTAIESGFFKKIMISEMTLMLRDGKARKTNGIAEFIAPGRLRNPFFRWFTDLRIGRNGKWPWF